MPEAGMRDEVENRGCLLQTAEAGEKRGTSHVVRVVGAVGAVGCVRRRGRCDVCSLCCKADMEGIVGGRARET